YGRLVERPVYETYNAQFMNRDLAAFVQPADASLWRGEPAARAKVSFRGKYPADFLVQPAPKRMAAWHLVGGLDALEKANLTGKEPNDGYPVLLADWIQRDG